MAPHARPPRRDERRAPRGVLPVDDRRVGATSLRGAGRRPGGPGPRALVYGALLIAGLVGVALTGWSMLEANRSARVPARLGLERVAHHWHDLLALLALPVLMFCAVLSLWAGYELYRLWRAALDPYADGRPRRAPRDARPPGEDRPRSDSPERLRLPGPR